jgi:hypothetical protein
MIGASLLIFFKIFWREWNIPETIGVLCIKLFKRIIPAIGVFFIWFNQSHYKESLAMIHSYSSTKEYSHKQADCWFSRS